MFLEKSKLVYEISQEKLKSMSFDSFTESEIKLIRKYLSWDLYYLFISKMSFETIKDVNIHTDDDPILAGRPSLFMYHIGIAELGYIHIYIYKYCDEYFFINVTSTLSPQVGGNIFNSINSFDNKLVDGYDGLNYVLVQLRGLIIYLSKKKYV